MTPDDGVLNVEYILTNFCVYAVWMAVVAPPCSVIVTQTRVFDSLDVVSVSVAVSSVVSSVSTVSGVVVAAAAVDLAVVELDPVSCAFAVLEAFSPTNADAASFFCILQSHPAHVSSSNDPVCHDWPAPEIFVESHSCLPVLWQRN